LQNAKRCLELLLGRYPSADLATGDKLTAVPPPIATGISSEILERRPDLIAAENRVASAFYKEREAELLHLPRFSFSVGLSINNLSDAISNLAAGIFPPSIPVAQLKPRLTRQRLSSKRQLRPTVKPR
jgi:multidrug efflux system outer membrane protein